MSTELVRRVEQACAELAAEGKEISFTGVAVRAGVGRNTLYRRPELRALVAEHRRRGQEAFTLSGLIVQVDQLRTAVEALAAKVRHHDEILRRANWRSRNSA